MLAHSQRVHRSLVRGHFQTFREPGPVLRTQVPNSHQILQSHPVRVLLQNHPGRVRGNSQRDHPSLVRGNSQRDHRSPVRVHQKDYSLVHQTPGRVLQIPKRVPGLHRTPERAQHQIHPEPGPLQNHHHRILLELGPVLRTYLMKYGEGKKGENEMIGQKKKAASRY